MVSLSYADINLRKFNTFYYYVDDTYYVTIDNIDTRIRLLELDTSEISKPEFNQELEWSIEERIF